MKKILTRFTSPPEEAGCHIERLPMYILLENIRSLYNVGSIFRTADAARINTLFLTGITGRPPRKEIAKTALGAQNTVPWHYEADPMTVIPGLKNRGVSILAVEQTDESVPLWKADFRFPVCFVFGYEIEGISDRLLAACDGAVEIPMYGYKGSLNVSVSCAVVIYEALRRLKSDPGFSDTVE